MNRPCFEPVNTHVSFPKIEEDVLSFWKEKKIFQKSLELTRKENAFVFFDGPPFATGLPHYGHLLAGTLKDIVPRYWTMRGNYVERRFGWDCHGLPVENEMEKEFKVSGKKDIEKIGIHLFNEACRSIVLRYTGQWESVVNRMGRWVDFENQYRTMDPAFMESIWWVFSQIWKKGPYLSRVSRATLLSALRDPFVKFRGDRRIQGSARAFNYRFISSCKRPENKIPCVDHHAMDPIFERGVGRGPENKLCKNTGRRRRFYHGQRPDGRVL